MISLIMTEQYRNMLQERYIVDHNLCVSYLYYIEGAYALSVPKTSANRMSAFLSTRDLLSPQLH
jgi:hypothetical protein